MTLTVFEYRLIENPDRRLILVSSGSTVEMAEYSLALTYGEDRFMGVKAYMPGEEGKMDDLVAKFALKSDLS